MSTQNQGQLQTDAPGSILKAWASYFKFLSFATAPPGVSVALGSTTLIDDNSKGPYPVYRPFTGEHSIGAQGAGVFAVDGIANLDDLTTRSVLVIDWIAFQFTAAANLLHGVFSFPLTGYFANYAVLGQPLYDMGLERDLPAIDAPRLVAGKTLGLSSNNPPPVVQDVNGALYPAGDALLHQLTGPFLLGPQSQLLLQPDAANIGITVYYRGRYYPG